MSYSLSLRAASILALAAAAAAALDNVIEAQPAHARDKDAALANLDAHAKLVGEPAEGEELIVSMHGSISVSNPTAGEPTVYSAGSGCSVWRQKATPQA